MSIEITIPSWTESEAEEGFIANWFARDGATVRAGEVLGELMVEKATIEISAPQDGTIQNIRLQRGDVVKPGMVVAELVPTGEAAAATTDASTASVAASALSASATATAPAEAGFIPASPMARRLARELGVDLTRVTPAHGQRITEDDVRRAAAATTVGGSVATMSPTAAVAPPPEAGETLTGRRKVIAERMLKSMQTSAQLTLTTEVGADELVAARERAQASLGLTYTDLLAWIVIQALRQHPAMNATLEGDRLRVHDAIHLGLAVAVPDGLVVPVVRDAGRLTLEQLAARSRELTERARANASTPAELSGSTFSLTTLGFYEIDAFTPILNAPEVGILGIGRVHEAVVPREGKIVIGQLMTLSLTFDHRAVDGAPAAAFLQTVKHLVESRETYAEVR
ncbi:MAG TPA: dihydrolipoamide acetyltransferase family protein [Ktedonobacterales bacterium]|nr:dihydrolipoamide acetyltransferase family protein [Ktedonobacterales bacterium]